MTIYKSLIDKYTDEDIERLSGVVSFLSYKYLLDSSISKAVNLRLGEVIVGLRMDSIGIAVLIETT